MVGGKGVPSWDLQLEWPTPFLFTSRLSTATTCPVIAGNRWIS